MKKITIAGGTGFLGKALENFFYQKGYQISILTRSPKKENHFKWDAKNIGDWISEIETSDVLINLTGKCVDCRYTEKNKREIINSRVESTRILNKAIQQIKSPPAVFLNASSGTIYVHAETQKMTEDNGIIGDDFSMNVCKAWEKEFFSVQQNAVRKVALRTSIVLGKNGGAFPKLKMITRLGLGGHQGNGQQNVTWIHEEDFCEAVDFIIQDKTIEGPINIASPNPVSNYTLMKKVRDRFKIPFGIPQPAALLEIGAKIIGTETELLLKSRNYIPKRLMEKGFTFKFNVLEEALRVL